MSEEFFIRHCAPTLAGLKTANLFSCPCQNRKEVLDGIRGINNKLRSKGLRAVPLRFSRDKVLIYLYRPQQLTTDIAADQAAELLEERGYDTASCAHCITQLMHKLQQKEEFPHEIGLFLGYPVEDVQGFIVNHAKGCKCTGYWKVYGDEAAAKKKFAQYKKCTEIYCAQWENGKNIEQLTVAG